MKILCCHSFQVLLDLLIHMCFIFSLKISFSLPEGSNSEFHGITFNRAGIVSQTFAKSSWLWIISQIYASSFIIWFVVQRWGKISVSYLCLVSIVPKIQTLTVVHVFPNNDLWKGIVFMTWKYFLPLKVVVLKARNIFEGLTCAQLICWSLVWQSTWKPWDWLNTV